MDYKVTDKDTLFVRGTVQPRHGITAPLAAGWINGQENYTFYNGEVGSDAHVDSQHSCGDTGWVPSRENRTTKRATAKSSGGGSAGHWTRPH